MPTGYHLLTVDALAPEAMAAALARCFGVAAGDVGVAEADADPELRNWAAPVLCTYAAVSGDLTRSLDLYAGSGSNCPTTSPGCRGSTARRRRSRSCPGRSWGGSPRSSASSGRRPR